MNIFLSVYPDLVLSVKPCVMTVADHCYSIGLLSPDIYDQLLHRQNWIDDEKTRNLLSSIRTILSARPTALKEFVNVLSQVDYCRQVADKIQQQLPGKYVVIIVAFELLYSLCNRIAVD